MIKWHFELEPGPFALNKRVALRVALPDAEADFQTLCGAAMIFFATLV